MPADPTLATGPPHRWPVRRDPCPPGGHHWKLLDQVREDGGSHRQRSICQVCGWTWFLDIRPDRGRWDHVGWEG